MDPYTLTATAIAAANANPNQSIGVFRVFVIGLIGLAFLVAGLAAVFGPGRKGNTRKSWDIAAASLIGLIPIAIGAAGIALALGASLLGWAVPWISG